MFSIFRKFFGQPEPKAVVPASPVRRVVQPVESGAAVPSVEVAHLSLATIVGRFPDELKALVLHPPDAAATIALPLQLIYKQLASGAVKMSLASLHRQAPPGVLAPLAPGDKRQVEIPLKEVFRHVSPQALKRRVDQRPLEAPGNEFNLFGNADKPYEITPTTPENPSRLDSTALHFNPPSRLGKLEPATPPMPVGKPSRIAPANGLRMSAPPVESNGAAAAAAPADAAPVTLPLALLASSWPVDICGEIAAFDPATTVTLNGGAVAAGLSRGRVTFTWAEIRRGLQPPPEEPTYLDGETELLLPLKVVAPAFLAATKNGRAGRKSVELDESIPALFSDAREPAPPAATLPPPPVAPALEHEPVTAPASAEEIPAAPAPTAEPEVAPAPVSAVCAPQKLSQTVGEIFGQPDQHEFTPAELVAGTVKLPGVAGAIVALQEGLQVASALPEGIKSDVVAAFLPQIFARLNQYAGEMKLGEVDDLLFTTHGAHCQIYRLGFVYFAVLGHPGEALPWQELQLIAAELGRQTH